MTPRLKNIDEITFLPPELSLVVDQDGMTHVDVKCLILPQTEAFKQVFKTLLEGYIDMDVVNKTLNPALQTYFVKNGQFREEAVKELFSEVFDFDFDFDKETQFMLKKAGAHKIAVKFATVTLTYKTKFSDWKNEKFI